MKAVLFAFALPFLAASPSAQAMPLSEAGDVGGLITRVQMDCNASRCLDLQTGIYTQSGCNRRGCYPISGPQGRLGPYGEDQRFYGRRRDYRSYDDDYDDRPRYRRYRD